MRKYITLRSELEKTSIGINWEQEKNIGEISAHVVTNSQQTKIKLHAVLGG